MRSVGLALIPVAAALLGTPVASKTSGASDHARGALAACEARLSSMTGVLQAVLRSHALADDEQKDDAIMALFEHQRVQQLEACLAAIRAAYGEGGKQAALEQCPK